LGCHFDRRFGGLRLGFAPPAGDLGDVNDKLVPWRLGATDRETSSGFVQQRLPSLVEYDQCRWVADFMLSLEGSGLACARQG
jgi:hypothetical protein